MTNIIVGLIILIIVGAAVTYIEAQDASDALIQDAVLLQRRKKKHQAVAVGATAVNRTYY